MRKILFTVGAAVVAAGVAGGASAQTASVTYQVTAIEEMALSGSPLALVIDNATKLKNGVTNSATTWDMTSNKTNTKVTAAIDLAMAPDVTLKVDLAAPTGATNVADAALGTTAVDLVTGITKVQQSGLVVTYTLNALPTAGVVASTTRTVTYTIVTGT